MESKKPTTRSRGNLKLIIPAKSKRNSYVCDTCSMSFKRKKELKDHISSGCFEKSFSCKICGKRFTTKGYLATHLRFVHGPKAFICEKGCGQTFVRQCDLDQHYIMHDTEKPFMCTLCGDRFKLENFYKLHVKVHKTRKYVPAEEMEGKRRRKRVVSEYDSNDDSEEEEIVKKVKVFPCDICNENFTTNYNMKKHREGHSLKKKTCFACNPAVQFDDTAARKEHYDTFHGGKPFKCQQCSRLFRFKGNWQRHEKTHGDLICLVCNATFSDAMGFKKHSNKHLKMDQQRIPIQRKKKLLRKSQPN